MPLTVVQQGITMATAKQLRDLIVTAVDDAMCVHQTDIGVRSRVFAAVLARRLADNEEIAVITALNQLLDRDNAKSTDSA